MKAVGVNYMLRKAGALASSTTEISQEGDGIRVNTQFRDFNYSTTIDYIA